jgi:hypothetical protein
VKADEKITNRLRELVTSGEKVLVTRRPAGAGIIGDDRVDSQMTAQWITSVQSLFINAFGADSVHLKNFAKYVQGYVTYSNVVRAQGVLKAAVDDYVGGHLFNLRNLVEAEVFDDFLEQAEHLLSSGYFQAAAVIAGCVLEDGMRKLCVKYAVNVSPNPKLDQMNSDLAKAGAYNKLVQKRVTALADVRNKAAHGHWTQFARSDVQEMLSGVRRFIEEFCA